jgi:NDP-sugar pyrophosphorylase family protein
MTVFRNEGHFDTSNVEFTAGRIVRYDKRQRTPAMRYIDWGLGVFAREAFLAYPEDRPLDLAEVYRDLLAAGDLTGFEVTRRFYEIGSPEGIRDADEYIRQKAQGRRQKAKGRRPKA